MNSDAAKTLLARLQKEAQAAGYFINPENELVMDLMEGLCTNQNRYGYLACPCRLAEGAREKDRDIICPCDYRDLDLNDFGTCYCALYVSEEIALSNKGVRPIPERRQEPSSPQEHHHQLVGFGQSGIPVWRCKVCGYLCARQDAPLKCPICKAEKDRFERFA